MMKKQYAVLGLGKFGISVANTLNNAGCEVMVVDIDADKVQQMADDVSCAVQADVSDPKAMESLGISNVDVAIIGLAENMEASILATILAKEAGVPFIMAKAISTVHGKILRKVGADQIVYPEIDSGIRVARNLLSGNFMDLVSLSDEFSIVEMRVPDKWSGKSVGELELRNRYRINIIAKKTANEISAVVRASDVLTKDEMVVAIGSNEDLEKIRKMEHD